MHSYSFLAVPLVAGLLTAAIITTNMSTDAIPKLIAYAMLWYAR